MWKCERHVLFRSSHTWKRLTGGLDNSISRNQAVLNKLLQCKSSLCLFDSNFDHSISRYWFGEDHPKYADCLADYGFYLISVDSVTTSVKFYIVSGLFKNLNHFLGRYWNVKFNFAVQSSILKDSQNLVLRLGGFLVHYTVFKNFFRLSKFQKLAFPSQKFSEIPKVWANLLYEVDFPSEMKILLWILKFPSPLKENTVNLIHVRETFQSHHWILKR